MPSVGRQPYAIVTLGGAQVGCEKVSVGQPKKASAGTCSIDTTLTDLLNAGLGLDWLAEQTEIDVSISFSTGDDDATLMFTGTIDKCEVEASTSSQTVKLSGRDATSKPTNGKSNQKYINQTSQEVAQTIAGNYGLTLQSDGGTGLTGKNYTAETAKLTGNQSDWTVLRQLAEAEGKVVAVYGSNLYFKTIDDGSLPEYPVVYQPATPGQLATSTNLITIKLGRNFQAAKKITIKVNSWDHKAKQLVTSTQSSGDGDPEQTYEYQHHQKTQDQADSLAKSKLKEHSRHEFDVALSMPGDVTLTPFFQIALSGTNSGFDQNYNIDHIDHSMSAKEGYRMTISTKAAKKGRNS